jgi:hypothetical protein
MTELFGVATAEEDAIIAESERQASQLRIKVKMYGALDLTPVEIDRLLRHAWELQGIYARYFFFDENCSFNLLYLLDVARPSLRLTAHMPGFELADQRGQHDLALRARLAVGVAAQDGAVLTDGKARHAPEGSHDLFRGGKGRIGEVIEDVPLLARRGAAKGTVEGGDQLGLAILDRDPSVLADDRDAAAQMVRLG